VEADLRGMSFRGQLIDQLNLTAADLTGCDFRNAVFVGGTLSNAKLMRAQFENADLRAIDLSGFKPMDVSQYCKGAVISVEQAASLWRCA
jgi:fluoroquinolone resistance protein